MNLYDKNRREIMVGDIVRIFHFTGARRKRYFMYKQVAGSRILGTGENQVTVVKFLHLTMNDDGYYQEENGEILDGYEIVQGMEAHWETLRRKQEPTR